MAGTEVSVIHVNDHYLKEALSIVEHNIERIKQLKEGRVKPDRCNTCGWCRQTKVLKRPISTMDLTASI